MTGLEFMDALRLEAGGIPCALVMLTGIADERVAVRAVNAGATDYVPKSENMEAILEHSIFNAIDKFRLEKELDTKRAELARSEHLHRSLMKALPQLVFTADADGRVSFGNRQWWEYLGIAEDDASRLDPHRFEWAAALHPDDRERWWRNWRDRTASSSHFDIEARLCRASDKQYRWHLVRAVRLDPGLDAAWLATCTDIEDQKRAEQAMVQRQKWDSIGLLAGGVAHDFNNLLVGVLGGAQLRVGCASRVASHSACSPYRDHGGRTCRPSDPPTPRLRRQGRILHSAGRSFGHRGANLRAGGVLGSRQREALDPDSARFCRALKPIPARSSRWS